MIVRVTLKATTILTDQKMRRDSGLKAGIITFTHNATSLQLPYKILALLSTWIICLFVTQHLQHTDIAVFIRFDKYCC